MKEEIIQGGLNEKSFGRKITALLLVFQMALSMVPLQAFAASSYSDSYHDLILREELRKAVDESLYPEGMFEFLAAKMNTSEDLSWVEFAIVRKGGTSGPASVTFKAMDITSKYGEDYTISVPKSIFPVTLPPNPDSKPLIESFEELENTSLTTSSGIRSDKVRVTTGTSIQYEELPGVFFKEEAKESGLRTARDAFTNTTSTRATWRQVDQDTKNTVLKAHNETFDSLPGVTYTFDFEDGEYIKIIRFNTLDDKISEDEEQVLFLLQDAEGASLGETITAYMNIQDNEEKEKVIFEMDDDQIRVDRLAGYAEVQVRRTAGLYRYGLISVGTAALTAEPGLDYEPLTQDLRFVPGQESQTVRIPLLQGTNSDEISFLVKLDPESPNITDKNTRTLVTIAPKPSYIMEAKNISETKASVLMGPTALEGLAAGTLKIYIKNLEENEDSVIESNPDAYVIPKTWKTATTYEAGPARYVGTLAFAEDYNAVEKIYTTSDVVSLVPKYAESFKDTSKVYLWGYKIERRGGLSGDKYHYVQADTINIKELTNNQVIDYKTNKPIYINHILMEGQVVAIMPVFKAKPCFVKINFDPDKGGMDKNSFSNGQIFKVGMMDTIEFRAYAKGSNAVSGYDHILGYDPLYEDGYYPMPEIFVEAYREDQPMDQIETMFGWRMPEYSKAAEIKINPSLPGELNFKPVDRFSVLTVLYGTSSLTVMADPTFEVKDKGSVLYIPEEGQSLAGNSENPLIISPIERNKMYIISGSPDEGYRMVWKDWSGDVNRDGRLSREEVDNLGNYEANFDRKAVAGNFFTYVPNYDYPLIYYSFEPKGANTAKGTVSGRVLLRGRNILNLSGGQAASTDKPLAGITLNINGHTVYTDEKGEFEIEHSDFRSNEYHNIIVTYNGRDYLGHVNVNAFTSIVINEYDTFNPYSLKGYNLNSSNKEIDFRIIDNRMQSTGSRLE